VTTIDEINLEDPEAIDDDGYGRRVGERLRAIRRQKRLSLQDVEANSDLEFKASVLGAYERGERAISVPRLHRLATVYDVPVEQLLPVEETGGQTIIDLTGELPVRHFIADQTLTFDLNALANMVGTEAEMLTRYIRMIQVQRQDFNGRVLTIRKDDLRAVACILGVATDRARGRLDQLGLCISAATVTTTSA
jgi:transcriptional regulator with XRE-family HTH domain